VTSILIWRRPCAELRWPEVQITPQLSAGSDYRILAYGRGQDARRGYQVLRGFTLELRGLLYSNCPVPVPVPVSMPVVGSSSGSQSGSAAGLWARPTAGRGGVSGARSDLAASSAARCRSRLSSSNWYAWSRRHSSPRNNSSVPGNCARTAGATAIVTTASISLTRCPSFVYLRCYRSQRNGEP